ncbi:MAG: ammonium transporter [Spirochaetota bacterium]|nr:ammonium transporter [Spirochaetota bacterium]
MKIFSQHAKLIRIILYILCLTALSATGYSQEPLAKADSGHTAWLLISSALVLLMIPGLAFFYGGMVRSKNILNTMMLSFIALGVITVQWVFIGYNLAFGDDIGHFIGWNTDYLFLKGITQDSVKDGVPHLLFMAFQGMFAVITPALISGGIAERIKFGSYVLFIVLWSTLVYDPVCHWVWGGGWVDKLGETLFDIKDLKPLDFAGGTVVHLNAGISALALIIVLGRRKGFPHEMTLPNNLNFTILGAGLLWFGWFGFNAGSALTAGTGAALAFVNTFVAGGAGALGWALAEVFHRGKASALGVASGIIGGLVAITPAAGFVEPVWAVFIGFVAGLVCYGGVLLKGRFKYDDTLDVFGIHGLGGIWGALATGIFATVGSVKGLIAGNHYLLWVQLVSLIGVAIYAFVVTWLIAIILDKLLGLRVSEEEEITGLDQTQHGETGYNI